MKKITKIILPLALALTASGCALLPNFNKKSNSSSQSSQSTTQSSASSQSGTSSSSSSSQATTYSLTKVVNDINTNFTNAGYGDIQLGWNSTYQEYVVYVTVSTTELDETSANLGGAAYLLADYLPSYLNQNYDVYGDPTDPDYYDLFDDNSYYYYLGYSTPDESVDVAVTSYVYEGELGAQIEVYEPEE